MKRRIEKELIKAELTPERFIRETNNAGNQIFEITCQNAPHVMREIGRVRELSFREAGGGTGKEIDLDEFDLDEENPYKQLLVWDPETEEIVGGYRYHICNQEFAENENYKRWLATSELFHFSDRFVADYLPHMIELGRSFVQPQFQSTKRSTKSIFALDNLWDGLGHVLTRYPGHKYFFGKVTMYPVYPPDCRDKILYFMDKHFGDRDGLVTPIVPLQTAMDKKAMETLFSGETYQENYKILSQQIRSAGQNIPPLINSYMNLSPTMKSFGTAINPTFGHVEETGIMITIPDLYEEKISRHIKTYSEEKLQKSFDTEAIGNESSN